MIKTTDNISKLSVIHIEEIIQVSKENNPYYTQEHNHQWLDEKGWLHRNCNVIRNTDGAIFNITLDIAKSRDGRIILYATNGQIKKVGQTDVKSLKIKASRSHSNFDNIISDKNKNNNTDFKKDIRYSLTEPGEITDADIVDLFEDSEEAFDYDFTADNIKISHETKEAIKDTIKTLVELNNLTRNKRISDNDLRKLCKQAIQKCDSKQNINVYINYIA